MTAKRPRAYKESLDENEISPNHEFWEYFTDDDVDGEADDDDEQEDDSQTRLKGFSTGELILILALITLQG